MEQGSLRRTAGERGKDGFLDKEQRQAFRICSIECLDACTCGIGVQQWQTARKLEMSERVMAVGRMGSAGKQSAAAAH